MTSAANGSELIAATESSSLNSIGFSLVEREALYQDFLPLVSRLVGQYGDDPELRKDLPGEIYCRFCDLLAVYDPQRGIPLKPFLVRTLSAAVYAYARRRWRQQRREVCLDWMDPSDMRYTVQEEFRSWDDRLVEKQYLQTLPMAIARLPRRQRQVLIWRYYEGRSYEEIARLLNVQMATARSLLRHGHNNLRHFFAAQDMI
jgi:RNA polymerase sigma factor (sigma-70 family)